VVGLNPPGARTKQVQQQPSNYTGTRVFTTNDGVRRPALVNSVIQRYRETTEEVPGVGG
jgi:hypothetical protein